MNDSVNYDTVCAQLSALVEGVPYEVANLANASALLWQEMPGINWVGFYKMEDGALVLGPFQGKPACIRIPVGRGVCACCQINWELLNAYISILSTICNLRILPQSSPGTFQAPHESSSLRARNLSRVNLSIF